MKNKPIAGVYRQIKPYLCAILLGMMGAWGFYSAVGAGFLKLEEHPYQVPFYMVCAFLSLIACILLVIWYFYRFDRVCRKGLTLALSFLVVTVSFCVSFWLWEWSVSWLEATVHPFLS